MVGQAVCREFINCRPARIVVCSLFEEEAQQAIHTLRAEQERLRQLTTGESPEAQEAEVELIPEWGNLFVRTELKHLTGGQAIATAEGRRAIIEDTLTPMSAEVARRFFLYQLVLRYKPHIIIDGINTATGIAYADVFTQARNVWSNLQSTGAGGDSESIERLLCSQYIPQLIRHVDVLYRAMVAVNTKAYLKLGTSGTGGMGWNIPYTHGEERPSSVLLSKSAVAGAHTLLLFLLARTPGIASLEPEGGINVSKAPPTTKEIKPTAMIGWRSITHGDVYKRGAPIILEDIRMEDAVALQSGQPLPPGGNRELTDKRLCTVFVDTGENGLFSTEEFIAITSPGQMEFVTPEEIARNVLDEVRGHNTGKDVLNALSVACMGPTYRAGFQRERAIQKLRELEKQHGCESVAFENLGPPRLSKLLYESVMLKRLYGTVQAVLEADGKDMVAKCKQLLREDWDLMATPVTIGIPILWEEEGQLKLLRGRTLKTPHAALPQMQLDDPLIEEWTHAGWIDLRESNMQRWKQRMQDIITTANSIPSQDTSSRYVRDRDFWAHARESDWPIHPGEIVAWIFINEDKGERGRE